MAVLSDTDRADLFAEINRDRGAIAGMSITKADLRAALNAADDWANTNASAYNSALPLPARTAMTADQKAALLMYVIRKRRDSGSEMATTKQQFYVGDAEYPTSNPATPVLTQGTNFPVSGIAFSTPRRSRRPISARGLPTTAPASHRTA
jgi:hypothetical protein